MGSRAWQVIHPMAARMPSPQEQFGEVEEEYASKANYVFERATSFLLSHELAHAMLGHLDVIERPKTSDQVRREMENEADQAAFSRLVGQDLDDVDKLAQAWAIIATHGRARARRGSAW